MQPSGWRRFRRLLGPDPAGDVEDELAFHIEMRAQDLVRRGEAPERARELAMRRFGDYESSHTECVEIDKRRIRHMARMEYLTELGQDTRYALRNLRRAPGFTAVAVASLALGIGATSAIFSVVHGVLIESLPYPAAERLHVVRTHYPDGTGYPLSPPDFMSVREGAQGFEQVEAFSRGTLILRGAGEPREVQGARVSDGLFELLGIRVGLGRAFVREENQPGQTRVAILGHDFWQREFGGDRAVLDSSLSVAGQPYAVVGVLAPGAELPGDVDVYAPLEYDTTFSAATAVGRRGEYLDVVGRARASLDEAAIVADLRRLGTRLQSDFPNTNDRLSFTSVPLREMLIGDVRKPLLVLLGAVGFVLLVACANVANLLLARASARQDEIAVRAALGAGRGRLVRQLMTESMVLGLAGGVAGLLIAYWGTRVLVAAQPADIPRLDEIGINGAVFLFTIAISLFTGFVFGVFPARQATGSGMMGALREGGRGGSASAGSHRARAGLVIAEMALAVVLLTGAGLLIRSFIELTRVDPGFHPEQAIAFRVTLQGEDYAAGLQVRDRVGSLLERLRALPRVTEVAATTQLPLSGRGSLVDFSVGDAPPPPDVNAEIGIASITPGYFRAIGTPVLRGRDISDTDGTDAPRVVLMNEAGARQWFGSEEALGKRVTAGGAEREIVGIVADVLERDPGRPAMPMIFAPYAQRTSRTVRIVIRAAGDPVILAPAIRAEVHALDRNLPVGEVAPLNDLLRASMARPRLYTSLLTLFAAVALTLAATGIFGVLSYAVAQRSREISIRMALGAPPGQVRRMIVGHAMKLAGVGLGIGIIVALAAGRVMESQLFGVSAVDPITLGAVVLVLAASAALASYMPARRAAALDPVTALRES